MAELSEVFDDLLAPALLAGALRRRPGQPGRAEEPDQRADRPVLPRGAGGDAGGQRGHRRAGQLTRYDADLVVPRRQRLECALLKGVTAHYVMSRDGAAQVQARERELIAELAEAIRAGAPGHAGPGAAPGL